MSALPLGPAELERLAARSWRGLEEEPYGDWLLRAGGGFTGRANSVLVLGTPPEALDQAVTTVGEWYAARGLAPRAQVPMPGGEDAEEARVHLLGRTGGLAALGLGLSLSLDELALGVSIGLLGLPLLPALALIGLQALVASQLGLRLGSRIGERNRERSEKAAGVILLLLAAFLLALHLAGR